MTRTDDDKRRAAEAAVVEIQDGMIVGLGTGSTATHAVAAIGARVRAGLRIDAVATSDATATLAVAHGITVRDFADIARLDLAIDGVDEIDDRFFAIKGAGGAMLREKLVAVAADRMIAIADGSKRVARIGAAPVPVEILPFARASILAALGRLGRVTVRQGDAGPYRTDQGNLVVDGHFAGIADPGALAATLDAIPGVLGHGLFLREINAAYIGSDGVVTRLERSPDCD
ncbi:ribose 5-phosphate isomerase [Sphingomonas sp. Leaf17]|uniref:ribose-5-phosphate isomerase RpiA n=1 Tax=Sphingomonas sp. Leaf17 TaxID=1735683 RepID=UPI0006FC8A30|nr:ribose-5-phosphate isomerase RpiA [Sphingomonas sp. Leaf17]KQM67424.1 ribose 5-phosphate isomerase [Sphingomonas sp. Leaf17]